MPDLCRNCHQLFGSHPNPQCEHYAEPEEYEPCVVCGKLTNATCTDHSTPVAVCLTESCISTHDLRAGHAEDEPLSLAHMVPNLFSVTQPKPSLPEAPLPQDKDEPAIGTCPICEWAVPDCSCVCSRCGKRGHRASRDIGLVEPAGNNCRRAMDGKPVLTGS